MTTEDQNTENTVQDTENTEHEGYTVHVLREEDDQPVTEEDGTPVILTFDDAKSIAFIQSYAETQQITEECAVREIIRRGIGRMMREIQKDTENTGEDTETTE